ncbi:MAG: hypothetical protein AAGF71_04135 [Pseudomonadota bacterium]
MTGQRFLKRRAEIWDALKSTKHFTIFAVMQRFDLSYNTVQGMILSWQRVGLVQSCGTSKKGRRQYRVIAGHTMVEGRPVVNHPPAAKNMTPWDAMWRTVRHCGEFSPSDLQSWASTPDRLISEKDAKAFCKMLMQAKLVRVVLRARARSHEARYLLHTYPGPIAPQRKRVQAIWCPNTRQYLHVQEPSE